MSAVPDPRREEGVQNGVHAAVAVGQHVRPDLGNGKNSYKHNIPRGTSARGTDTETDIVVLEDLFKEKGKSME